MTDSMKFGPEWLRNMSSDNSASGSGSSGGGGGGGSGGGINSSNSCNNSGSSNNSNNSTTSITWMGGGGNGGGGGTGLAPPRFQQAEFRYGREEMLSLCIKDMKMPEILPSFKKLYVEKEQLPLALSPSTEDEGLFPFVPRPWSLRSPVSLQAPPRPGRGGSVDRGRGRPRLFSSLSFSTRPPFDEGLRLGGRGVDRVWPERNGGNDIGGSSGGAGSNLGDWNGSPSSSPRKEYTTHGRSSGMENWRRNRNEDDTGEGWRSSTNSGSSTASAGSSYRWSRSTSWRDEESSSSTNLFVSSGGGSMAPIMRSYSSSASVGHSLAGGSGGPDGSGRITTNGPILVRSLSQAQNSHDGVATSSSGGGNSAGGPRSDGGGGVGLGTNNSAGPPHTSLSVSKGMWDQQEDIPEWAMENTTDGGGSFDASGAFHVPNDDEEDVGGNERHHRHQSTESNSDTDRGGNVNNGPKMSTSSSASSSTDKSEPKQHQEDERRRRAEETPPGARKRSNAQNTASAAELKSTQLESEPSYSPASHALDQQQLQHHHPPPVQSDQQPSTQTAAGIPYQHHHQSSVDQSHSKHTSSDLADRMQEVADDMVEKLIMDDELTSAASSAGTSTSQQVPLMKPVSSSPTAGNTNSMLQRPLQVHGHPMMVQPNMQPTPPNELWYYRDPQNKIQGPFTGAEMAEWYRSDYFDENLLVRRVCDSRFATLGELVKMCGNSMPFLSSHLIPPLQITPVMPPLASQAASVVPPGPATVPVNTPKPISMVNPMLNSNEAAQSLSLQLQCLQKEYLLRQQSLIFNKLSASEQFALLSPEGQQQILQQKMTQVSLPDNIVNLPAFMNFVCGGGMNPSPFAMQQMMPPAASQAVPTNNAVNAPKTDLNQVKMPGASTNPFLNSGGGVGRPEFQGMNPLHNLIQGTGGGQPSMVPPTAQPPPQHPTATTPDDSIKTLLRHLQTTKAMPQNVTGYPQNMMSGLQHQMSWPGSANAGTPVSMWDFDPMANNIHVGMKLEMKTEQQILEEQRQQQQQQAQQQQTQHAQQPLPSEKPPSEGPKLQSTEPPASVTNSQQQAQTQPTQQMKPPTHPREQSVQPAPSLQPPQRPSKKSEEKPKSVTEEPAALKSSKVDDSLKKTFNKGNKSDKKDTLKKQQNDEERKREAEERKKQKEEKRKQQIEEERKRQQQQQEDEKRRQMLEEKKRQEEIDRHRRAKMLENAPPKQQSKSGSADSTLLPSRSSVNPWSNTTVAGVSAQATSLAEIQKAERERRTEERLGQMNQRKIQQMEIMSKNEPTLTWNAPAISVKSLAEIQAEEHRQQLAFEQAISAAEQRRKKDDLVNSPQSSMFVSVGGGGGGGGGPNSGLNSVSGGGGGGSSSSASAQNSSAIGSIWSSWNGKPAWSSSTSNAGFWEEPIKLASANTGTGSAAKQMSAASASSGGAHATLTTGANRLLSKSQTISNIQTSVGKNNHNNNNNVSSSIGGGENRSSNNSTKANNNGKGTTAAASNSNKTKSASLANNSATNMNTNNKKDDARNEFTSWCIKALSPMKSVVDVPTFIQFLQDIESPYEVKDYIRIYLGETKECTEFAKQFLERRSKYKNQQRAQNAHIDDMCSPAPAINPSSNDFQEVKGKGKKVKKSKMTKLDARILGFSVTAAQDRINVGDRDYGDAA